MRSEVLILTESQDKVLMIDETLGFVWMGTETGENFLKQSFLDIDLENSEVTKFEKARRHFGSWNNKQFAIPVFGEDMVENRRIVWELPVEVDEVERSLVFDANDVVVRYKNLSKELSSSEVVRVARKDEVGQLVAALAEMVKLDAYPYELFLLNGELCSLVSINGDGGGEIWVARRLLNMLESRVKKMPENQRDRVVLDVYREILIPELKKAKVGESVVFFSPPDENGGVEGKYGLMFVLRKLIDENTGLEKFEAVSLKLEWDKQGYLDILRHYKGSVINYQENEFYRNVVSQVLRFKDGGSLGQVAGRIFSAVKIENDSQHRGDVADWLDRNIHLYGSVKLFVEKHVNRFVDGIIGGDQLKLQNIVKSLQLEWLKEKAPAEYREIIREIQVYGYSYRLYGCGWAVFGDGLIMNMMGKIGVDSGYDGPWHIGNCRTCSANGVEVGVCDVCKTCQKKFDEGLMN